MRQARALALSLLLHLLPVGAYLFFSARPGLSVKEAPAEENKDDYVIEAPLGQVFVTEASLGEEEKKPEEKAADGEKPMAFPDEVKKTAREGGESAAVPGTPDGEAQPLGKIEPTYPPVSRRLGEQGEAVFLLAINPDGTVASAELERSSGFDRLDSAARAALLTASFHVSASATAAIPVRKRYRVEFRLAEAEKP